MKKLLVILLLSVFTNGYSQSTPHYYKATEASFKSASDTAFSTPLSCDDVVLVNNDTREITVISESCSVYKITSSDIINENKSFYIKIDAVDRDDNKVFFRIYTYADEDKTGLKNMVSMFYEKDSFAFILYASEKKVF